MTVLKTYRESSSGNFATLMAFGLGVITLCVGAAVDVSTLTSTKSKAADVADGMALAAAIAARNGRTSAERVELGEEAAQAVFDANKASLNGVTLLSPTIDINDVTKDVKVSVLADVDYNLMSMFGAGSSTVTSDAVVSYKVDAIPPISMAFSLDTSGSMNVVAGAGSETRMEALQEATELLFEALESEADNPALLKASFSTTSSSYNTAIVDSADWAFGEESITDVIDYVNTMTPEGGTNSTPSMEYTLEQMIINRPVSHPDWKGYVLFMTDGDNNDKAQNPATLELCETLRDDPAITVITVAFGAPPEAQDMLEECATDGNYYESDNSKEIKKHFAKIGREIGEVIFRLKS